MIVPLPDDVDGAGNPLDARALAYHLRCVPQRMSVEARLQYHVVSLSDANASAKIRTVSMTGLGTEALEQTGAHGRCVFAVKHFQMPLADLVRWDAVGQRAMEIRATAVLPQK
jgi:hypothetical protein